MRRLGSRHNASLHHTLLQDLPVFLYGTRSSLEVLRHKASCNWQTKQRRNPEQVARVDVECVAGRRSPSFGGEASKISMAGLARTPRHEATTKHKGLCCNPPLVRLLVQTGSYCTVELPTAVLMISDHAALRNPPVRGANDK